MKITIAYLPGEERNAGIIRAFVKGLLPDVKVRESDRHDPYKHTYLTTRKRAEADSLVERDISENSK